MRIAKCECSSANSVVRITVFEQYSVNTAARIEYFCANTAVANTIVRIVSVLTKNTTVYVDGHLQSDIYLQSNQ